MKKPNINIARFFLTLVCLIGFIGINAQEQLVKQVATVKDTTVWGLPINNVFIKRSADLMSVGMDMKLQDYKLRGDRVSVFTPILKNGNDSIEFNSLGLYSRIRFIQYLREEEQPISGDKETSYQYSKRPVVFDIDNKVPYSEWMNGSTLYLRRCDYGCCNTLLDEEIVPIAKWKELVFAPQLIYETDIIAETVKERAISGRAYVDFPVNKIVIYPEYRRNTIELGKIIATIDSVKNDPDITVTSIHIAGTASPEGPYDNNVYLAKNRTIALKEYVRNLYNFPEGFITTDYDPVDWKGLREWLENNNIQYKDEILAIVNSDIEDFARNSKIKKEYPKEYEWLLKNVYPALRHSDYRIEYTIRQFSDVNEIAEIIKTAPQKLSLNEMYLLAKSLEPGTEEYNEVFETAVRMYPNDEIANLNAANIAISKGNLEQAAKYLEKAGATAKADYARGMLATKKGDYAKANEYFSKVAGELPQAAETIEYLNEILNIEK